MFVFLRLVAVILDVVIFDEVIITPFKPQPSVLIPLYFVAADFVVVRKPYIQTTVDVIRVWFAPIVAYCIVRNLTFHGIIQEDSRPGITGDNVVADLAFDKPPGTNTFIFVVLHFVFHHLQVVTGFQV